MILRLKYNPGPFWPDAIRSPRFFNSHFRTLDGRALERRELLEGHLVMFVSKLGVCPALG